MTAPRLSVALARTPDPDFADVQIVSLRGAPSLDAAAWVARVFTVRSAPWWVVALFALRQLLVPLLLLNPARDARSDPFAVREVVDGEALVVTDAPHLLFRLGVAVERPRSCWSRRRFTSTACAAASTWRRSRCCTAPCSAR